MSLNIDPVELGKEIIVTIGDERITGKDAVIRDLTVRQSYNPEFLGFAGSRKFIPVPTMMTCEIELSLVCSEITRFQDLFFGKEESKKIRNKRVEDCTIRELLFAVRQKINN